VPAQVDERHRAVAEGQHLAVLGAVADLNRKLVRVGRMRHHHRAGPGLHLGQRLPVIGVPVRGHDRPDRRVPDHLDQSAGLVGRVDKQALTRAGTAQQVGVVVHRAHRYLGHGQAADLTSLRRAADMNLSRVSHLQNLYRTDRATRPEPATCRPWPRRNDLENRVKILVLAGHHVRELLGYRECADVMRQALTDLARGEIQQPLRTVVKPRDAAGFMGLMPAYSPAGYGLKALVITPGNPAVGKDAHQGGVLLFAVGTGEPLAFVNASAVTEIRTAAVSAVATSLLARQDAAELAVIGTGVQGQAHAHALAATRSLTGIRITGRDPGRAREVAATLAGELGLPVTTAASVPEAVEGAGIVVTATNSSQPVLRREWLAAGAHVNAVGACLPRDRELDTATMAEAAVFADSRESVSHESGDFLLAAAEGADNPVRAELGELLTGTGQGRASEDEITVFESLGLAAEDLAAAAYLYEKAARLGAGTSADF
jgi:ornithine cyclodeaminase/alanine dehydrogenase-like protein (mu-crystallin family)